MPKISVERKQSAVDLVSDDDTCYEPSKESVTTKPPNPHVLNETKQMMKKLASDAKRQADAPANPHLVPVYSQAQMDVIQEMFAQKTAQFCLISAGAGLVLGFFAHKLFFSGPSISNVLPSVIETVEEIN